jgi:hypothetical protein
MTAPSRRVLGLLLLGLASPAAAGHALGTDVASLNFCMYGDCEARGTYAADPYGVYNPALMVVGAARHMPRGIAVSGSYYDFGIGAVDGDIGLGVATLTWLPVALQVAAGYVGAAGGVRSLPGIDMRFHTSVVRLAAAVDAERTLGLRGLSLGLAGVVPGTTSGLRLSTGSMTILHAEEHRDLELVPGVHWRGGEDDWFMVGGFLDVLRNGVDSSGLDPLTGEMLHTEGTSNVWFARVGTSVVPAVPLGLARRTSAGSQWASMVRLGIDIEYRNISVPNEQLEAGTTAFFGVDGPLLPDAWNPLATWVRPWILGGVDTRGGWSLGAGLYGQGPLRFLGCNQAYSSRPLVEFLGDRVNVLAVTCSVLLPL